MSAVIRHTDPDAFLEAAAPMRSRGESSASFFIAAAHAMKRTPPVADERVYFATCADTKNFGVAMQRDVGPAIVGASDTGAALAFADDLASDCPALRGVMGAPAASEAFVQGWRERTGRAHVLRVRLRQHTLTAVAAVPAARGYSRVAGEGDIGWLIDASVAFIVEVGMPDSVDRVRTWLPKRVARGDYWIWEDDGPTAFAGYNAAAPGIARIAPVYTFPARRNHGYATTLVAALSNELLARGKHALFLTTDAANPTSNAIYARIGFRFENEDYHFDFVDAGV